MARYYFKMLSGTIHLAERGRHRRIKWGEELPPESELRDGEVERLTRIGALATEKEWNAGEKVPHHRRQPHRSTLIDPRTLRDPEPPAPAKKQAQPATQDAQSAPGSEQGLDLASLDDEGLAALWDGHTPKVKDLLAAVGDDPELAQRVLEAEHTGTGGASRETLTKKLGKLVEGDE